MPKEKGRKLVAANRKARHDYLIDDTYEAGMVLQGQELTPHDYRGHHEDFVQYEVYILKLSGRQVNVGMITTARVDAAEARSRALEIAGLIANMAGVEVHEPRVKEGPYWPEQFKEQAAASDAGEAQASTGKPAKTYKRIEKTRA
jgi:hypothetical protein